VKEREISVFNLQNDIHSFNESRLAFRENNNPQTLAMGICIEAAELLQEVRYKPGNYTDEEREMIEHELADVIIYCFSFATVMGINIPEAVSDKLTFNEQRFPPDITTEDYVNGRHSN